MTGNQSKAEGPNLKDLVQMLLEEVTISLRHNHKGQLHHQECQEPVNCQKHPIKNKMKEIKETTI